jgi:peptidoglycan DL-endopeptidase LytE
MKGTKTCIASFIAILLLLITPISSYSKSAGKSLKSSARHKRSKQTSVRAPRAISGQDYSVQRGDNLLGIAKSFGTTPQAIKTANRMKNDRIKAGQTLRIPVEKLASAKPSKLSAEVRRDPYQTSMSAAPARLPDEDASSESPSTRLQLIQAGFQMLGVRYRFGGSGIGGIDCSGLVKNLFSKFNIDLPHSSREQYKQGQVVNRDELKAGDLVFFSSGGSQPTHVGIYLGDDKILHAARKARQVIVSDINKIWYKMRYLGARRVTDLWGNDPAPEPAQ